MLEINGYSRELLFNTQFVSEQFTHVLLESQQLLAALSSFLDMMAKTQLTILWASGCQTHAGCGTHAGSLTGPLTGGVCWTYSCPSAQHRWGAIQLFPLISAPAPGALPEPLGVLGG